MAEIKFSSHVSGLLMLLILSCTGCHGDRQTGKSAIALSAMPDTTETAETPDKYQPVSAMLVLPGRPGPGESFRILYAGGESIRKGKISVSGPSGSIEPLKSKTGDALPYWRIDEFTGSIEGRYRAELTSGRDILCTLEFEISSDDAVPGSGLVWQTTKSWDSGMETLYSAWINALFQGCDEQSTWTALHEVTRDQNRNFLYNHLSMGEDDITPGNSLIMEPDCADNPFFLRAYFAWKLGLPFGYHLCDRGSLRNNPKTGRWITNETNTSKTTTLAAFNDFLRRMKDGIHSGTARTALDDENSDYYPVALESGALRPGIVYADPYGHTLILVSRIAQKGDDPGILLSVDAQPDGTVGIKRFWKGNFLFNTSGVVGEPGFKAFRPIEVKDGVPALMKNHELTAEAGFLPFSLEQRTLPSEDFYKTMERLINPRPLDPETALSGLIQALHEQLMVRVISVANGEAWFISHPGEVIPMPSTAAGIFLAGGQWENFSTPNRDLRLLIAIDAVLGFPDLVSRSPEDYKIPLLSSPELIKRKLQSMLEQKVSALSVDYIRSDGSVQNLTVAEILERREAFEMAYNPNDGIEIRWGAPENSRERATCRRQAPANQLEKMRSLRTWFIKRLHPPT